MHVILTHEQADFDALASLFGAYLLDERALPVLPRRMNRNLRAFLTLYGAEFPFVDPRDLPQETIERVTLVDTQSLVTLKGMGEWTEVRVIDHHPRRLGLPAEWHFMPAPTGATTTVLVEAMQAHNGHLSVIQATLLLLGIYEDTGALTYASTTSRDVRAAAFLLDQGASLKIAVEFLNPPLSPEQRQVYENLAASAQTYEIAGRRIVIACADATGMSEEISSLAHKLRDSLDPDALFVLVRTDDGIRMVARSASDQIDVAAVASLFGGGGHGRAAAALIRPEGKELQAALLQETCSRLLEALPRFVRPPITVAQIMSLKPHLLSPEIPAQEVAALMQRYGYEGFPVVKDGRVVGLLTRRAVDRALAHKLNLPAASLMDAGDITVRPDDSIETLQARMTDSGWGQVPVVDENGMVIGIVTRTDLLKTMAPKKGRPARRNLASKLEHALPPERLALVRLVAEEAEARGMAVYVVGGFVRDLLLDRPSLDFDIVVEGDAIVLARALSGRHGGRITSHARFGTAKWFLPASLIAASSNLPAFIDLISARQEYYEHPTALPTVERGSIKLDLHRRDFTINTLALRLDGRHFGELHDYWGGLSDLERRLVRVLHSLSFVDDPTRMLRAVRFEQRFDFQIEARTLQLMEDARPLLDRLTGERIRHEFDLILDELRAPAMLTRMAELGLLSALKPALPWNAAISRRLEVHLAAPIPEAWLGSGWTLGGLPTRRALGYLLWLLDQPEAILNRIISRLRLTAPLARTLRAAAALYADLPSLSRTRPSAWVRRIEDLPLPAVYAVYCATDDDGKACLEKYAVTWRHVQPHTSGDALKSLGLPPGPAYQNILRSLRDAWLDGDLKNREEEKNLLKQLLEQEGVSL